MPSKMIEEMNEKLDQHFTEDEVSTALPQLCPIKAPAPNGLPTALFQKYWQSVSRWVLTTSLNILNEGATIAPLNYTFIAVIPKIEKPKKITDYRPISFCNVIYKIRAKTIANRLENVLHHIISPTQSALIPERLIYDNIIIGYESLHKIRLSIGKKMSLWLWNLILAKLMREWSGIF